MNYGVSKRNRTGTVIRRVPHGNRRGNRSPDGVADTSERVKDDTFRHGPPVGVDCRAGRADPQLRCRILPHPVVNPSTSTDKGTRPDFRRDEGWTTHLFYDTQPSPGSSGRGPPFVPTLSVLTKIRTGHSGNSSDI